MARKRGTVRQRGKNWYSIITHNGKKYEAVAGPTKEAADKQLTQRLAEFDIGYGRTEKPVTFKRWAEEWWPTYKASLKPSTARSYQSVLDSRLLPFFAPTRMDRITPTMVLRFFREQAASKAKTTGATLAPKTLRNCLALLKPIFDAAVVARMIGRSPIEPKLLRLPKNDRAEREFLRHDEVGRLLEKVTDPETKCLFLVAIASGLRQGELLALGWEHLDFEKRVIRVRRAFSAGELQTPKTRHSIRDVAIGANVIQVLREHKLRCGGRSSFVFSNREGKPLDPGNIAERGLKPALQAAAIDRHVTFHAFRHTYASLNLNRGANIKWISRQLGHATVKITLDTYSHLIPEDHGRAVDDYDALIAGATATTSGATAGS